MTKFLFDGHQRIFPAALLGLLCLGTTAQAQTPAPACGTLTQLAAIDLTPLPNDSRMLVPVTVNGTPQNLLLGTSGGLITINKSAAAALHLGVRDTEKRVLDVNGFASRHYVRIDDLALAGAHAVKRTFALTPDPKAGIDPPDDGVFDAGLRYRLDVEMDFANRKLKYFSPAHCEGRVIYWPATVQGVVPLSIVHRVDDKARHGDIGGDAALMGTASSEQMDYFLSLIDSAPGIAGSDIRIKVNLDGQDFTANIDTSLQYSTLNSDAARARFDVTANSPGSAPVTSLVANDPNRKTTGPAPSESITVYGSRVFAHAFHNLAFGGVTVINPHLMVRPDRTGVYDPDNDLLTGSHIYRMDNGVEPDISIGMDILSKLHLYFAFPEHKLYVTPAGSETASVADQSQQPHS